MDARQQPVNGEVNHVTERIIACAFAVSNTLGAGFLEKVYENALACEIRRAGLEVTQQYAFAVRYRDVVVGEYVADMVVEKTVLVEAKAVRALDEVHTAQCLNYLRATGLRVCLLLNFGTPKVQIKRFVSGR